MRRNFSKIVLLLILVVLISEIKAQEVKIESISPNFNQIANTTTPEISATFDVSMDSSSFDSLSFSVMGERSADHAGEIIYKMREAKQ